jgi:hypothetical protein
MVRSDREEELHIACRRSEVRRRGIEDLEACQLRRGDHHFSTFNLPVGTPDEHQIFITRDINSHSDKRI